MSNFNALEHFNSDDSGLDNADQFGLDYFSLQNADQLNAYSSAFDLSSASSSFGARPLALAFAASSGVKPVTPVATPPTLLSPSSVMGTNGFGFKLVWDSTVSASGTFQANMINAAQLLANALTDKITVNVGITDSGTGGGASAGPDNGSWVSYVSTLAALQGHASVNDPTFHLLPTGASIQSQPLVAVWNAQLKLWGMALPTGSPVLNGVVLDGSATFATDISPGALTGVALHELSHTLGRVPYGAAPDVFDLFRYTAPAKMLFSSSIPASQAYFSIDGGITKLAYFGVSSDPSDFYNGTPVGGGVTVYNTQYDAFSEYYYANGSSYQYLSAVDLHLLDALGYHLSTLNTLNTSAFAAYSGTAPIVIYDTASNIAGHLDFLNSHINQIYSISQSDLATPVSITAAQSVADQSALMLLGVSENLQLKIAGTSGADTIYGVAGTDTINGNGGLDSITLNYHTTSDVIYFNSAVNSANLDKVTGFLATDHALLTNSSTSLNGLDDLYSGSVMHAGSSVVADIKVANAGAAFTINASTDIIDIVGKVYTNIAAVIADLSTASTSQVAHTYATFGANIAAGSHFLAEYSAGDGIHVAEITQGGTTPSTHLAVGSTGVDLMDFIGLTQHLAASQFVFGVA